MPLAPRINSAAGEPYAGEGWSPRLLRVFIVGPGGDEVDEVSVRRRHFAAISLIERDGLPTNSPVESAGKFRRGGLDSAMERRSGETWSAETRYREEPYLA